LYIKRVIGKKSVPRHNDKAKEVSVMKCGGSQCNGSNIGRSIPEPDRGQWIDKANREDIIAVLDNSPCGIVINKSIHGKVLYINRESFNLMGYTVSEVSTGRMARKTFIQDPKDRRVATEAMNKAIARSGCFRRIDKLVSKGGGVKFVEVKAVLLRNKNIVSIWTDVTRREEAEAELRERESRFRSLFEESSDAVLLLEGNKVIDCNRAAQSMLHCEEKRRILGTTLGSLSPRKQPDGCSSAQKAKDEIAVARQKKSHRFEWMLRRFNREDFPAEVTITAITLKGKEILYIVLRDITAWKKAEEALLRIKDALEDRVGQRTAELVAVNEQLLKEIQVRKDIEKELEKSREELRYLSEHLQRAREEERTRIAREVHDELGQSLSALKIDLICLGENVPGNHDSFVEQTKAMETQIDCAIQSIRTICSELRPPILEHFGLPAAIEWFLKDFQRRTGIRCVVKMDSAIPATEKGLSLVLFRILQESLTNILRHAQATRVTVSLKKEAQNLLLKVTDNGKGISKEQVVSPRSLGIIGIQERVRFWDGQSSFKGIPNKGTTMIISIPLDQSKGPAQEPQRKGVLGS
jgi:PAS domain S-box-containing protein